MNASDNRNANLIGGFWMIVSMGAFAVEDVFIKAVSNSIPLGQLLIIFGIGGGIIFAGAALYKREQLMGPLTFSRPMQIRMLFEVLGRLFYALAITLTPLSSATVILQATPLFVVAGATFVFREPVGWRRWSAILLGLLGVVVIVQPGTDSFSSLSVLAVIGTLGFAGRDLASRAAPSSLSNTILGLYGFLAVVIAGAGYALWQAQPFVWPDRAISLYLLGAVLFGVGAYVSLMKAMRTGDVSAVTPFRYTRLLFGVAFGVFLFGEPVSSSMMIGCVLIVVAGMIVLLRSRRIDTSR